MTHPLVCVQVLGLVMEAFDPSFYSANSNAMVALIKMVPDITPTQVRHHRPPLGSRSGQTAHTHAPQSYTAACLHVFFSHHSSLFYRRCTCWPAWAVVYLATLPPKTSACPCSTRPGAW
jgi:hypothetical protein